MAMIMHHHETANGMDYNPFVGKEMPSVITAIRSEMPFIDLNMPFVRISAKQAGFTLVELMITLIVAAVLMGIAVPSFKAFIQNSRITAQSNEVLVSLATARSEAIKRNANVVLCRSADPTANTPACSGAGAWETGWIIFQDVDANGAFNGTDSLLQIHEPLSGNNTLRANGALITSSVIFNRDGTSTLAGSDYFKLCDTRGAGSARAIVIETTGRARIARLANLATLTCP
jgi:type IV fimbrial biogenesis protein FimT